MFSQSPRAVWPTTASAIQRTTFRTTVPISSLPGQRLSSRCHLLLNRWPGRLLIGTVVLKVVLWIAEAVVGQTALGDWLNILVRVGLLVSLAYFLSRLVRFTRQRFLWRVRRRLVVSYIFI